jgi:hypothetical protein
VIAAYAAAGALAAGLATGWAVRDWKAGADDAEALQAARDIAQEQQRMVNQASARYQVHRADAAQRERIVTKEVRVVLEKPVYRESCLDDDGMRILTEDIQAANARRGFGKSLPIASAPRW